MIIIFLHWFLLVMMETEQDAIKASGVVLQTG